MATLADKIAVVTGASRGIGKAIALELADAGARVACVATRAEHAAETVAEIRSKGGDALALGCRVEHGAEVTAAFARLQADLGVVEILVNNAGVTHPQLTLDMTEENWDLGSVRFRASWLSAWGRVGCGLEEEREDGMPPLSVLCYDTTARLDHPRLPALSLSELRPRGQRTHRLAL